MEVLIADDSEFMLKVLENIVDTLEFEKVYTATDGDEAVQKYRKELPDLVLLDIIMEDVDGIEALKEIKDVNGEANVLMISAVGQEDTVEEALDEGAAGYVNKPFENKKVRKEIKDTVDL